MTIGKAVLNYVLMTPNSARALMGDQGSRSLSGSVHRLTQIDHRLLTYLQHALAGAIEVRD